MRTRSRLHVLVGRIQCAVAVALLALFVQLPVHAQPATARTLVVSPQGPYQTIDAALKDAETGDTIEVRGGTYAAPLKIDKSVSLNGIANPVIDGNGTGTLVIIKAPDVAFQGFTLRSTGHDLEQEDTGIVVQAPRVTVANNTLYDVLFGIYFASAPGGIARNNSVQCVPLELGVRGDGFRVWYSNNVSISDNQATNCRDMFFWYSNDLVIEHNTFRDSRYALHFMYNQNARVRYNTFEGSTVGSYFMYTDGLTLDQNVIARNRGVSGYGIALKDTDHVTITDNLVVDNQVGLYIDNSPTLPGTDNRVTHNLFAYNTTGITGQPSTKHNIITANSFVENAEQAATAGRGTLQGNTWAENGVGNYWSDYVGYDADGDGVGEISYRSEKLFESLTDAHPVLRLFTYSPATQALDFAAAAFPALHPEPKLVDKAPLMHYTLPQGTGNADTSVAVWPLTASLLLFLMGGGLSVAAMRKGL